MEKNKLIPLTKGKFAIVDEEDFDWLNQWKWCSASGYALREERGTRIRIRMHRLIANAPKGKLVDHINGNPLDNRRSNLRICTHQENLQNSPKYKNNISGFKGVHWVKEKNKWCAKIYCNGRSHHLGYFFDKTAAACMYNAAAKKHFGEFARLNRAA